MATAEITDDRVKTQFQHLLVGQRFLGNNGLVYMKTATCRAEMGMDFNAIVVDSVSTRDTAVGSLGLFAPTFLASVVIPETKYRYQ
jgi:hypothetical protein